MNTIPNLEYVEIFKQKIPRHLSIAVIRLQAAFAKLTRRILQAYPASRIITNYVPYATYLANRNLLDVGSDTEDSVFVNFIVNEHDEKLQNVDTFTNASQFIEIPEGVGYVDYPVNLFFAKTYMYQVNTEDKIRVTHGDTVVSLRYD